MYKLNYGETGKVESIQKENKTIPISEANKDYLEFLKWNREQDNPLDVDGVNIGILAEAEKIQKKQQLQHVLDELDIKKMRYLIEKEKGDLSGKKYFDEYEAETIKLREELKNV
jgi:hypothetical protein